MTRRWLYKVAVLGLIAGSASAQVTVYTKEKPPATPKLEDLALVETVSQYGITWTFDRKVRVGQFVTGDWYVVGPATVAKIDPKPLVGDEVPQSELDEREKRPGTKIVRNGSMVNPPARQEMAYDSGIRNWYKPDGLALPPIALKPGDTLVSTISLRQEEKAQFVYHSGGKRTEGDNCPVKVAAVLTCVDKPQPPDAFRPAYCDRQQTIYLARNLRRELLPKLQKVGTETPDPVRFAEAFRKPWLNTGFFGFDEPMENMPHYGQWVGQAVGDAALLLCLDFPPEVKEPLLLNFVQVGIDYWGAVKSGHPGWEGWGGHGSGRKLPIVVAGYLLGDEVMASPTKAFPKVEFGEDNQTRYGDCWTGAKVVFAGHSGVSSRTGLPPRVLWGPYEHRPPSEWQNEGTLKNYQSEAYRRANTSCCWVAQALALRILKLERQWNHDPFFDYVDRWMYEDDKPFRTEINKYFPDPNLVNDAKNWYHQGYTGERWVKPYWDAYRTMQGMPPTDGWKKEKQGPRITPEIIKIMDDARKK